MLFSALVWLALGLFLLAVGAEALVRGASRLAELMGIPRLVIGLTVVTFGTASPELTVSLYSALTGQGDIALGNAVGSCIFNVLFILGLSALIAPLAVSAQLVRWDVPILIAVSLILDSSGHDALPAFKGVMTGAVMPLTAATLLTLTVRAFRTRVKKPS
jgi:cation:H+ antiporter